MNKNKKNFNVTFINYFLSKICNNKEKLINKK